MPRQEAVDARDTKEKAKKTARKPRGSRPGRQTKDTTLRIRAKTEKPEEKPGEAKPRREGISVSVVDSEGRVKGKVSLPKELFGMAVNKTLMAQAVRVYLANQRSANASTKTRGEVEGSTRKIYRQKGTGRARHGAIRAPIFVGGGITFGPKPRDFRLNLPQKMKRAALASALTSKLEEKNVMVVDGLEALEPKTKNMVKLLTNIGAVNKSLLVVTKDAEMVVRAARNIDTIEILTVQNLNTYAVLAHPKLIFMKEALSDLVQTFAK